MNSLLVTCPSWSLSHTRNTSMTRDRFLASSPASLAACECGECSGCGEPCGECGEPSGECGEPCGEYCGECGERGERCGECGERGDMPQAAGRRAPAP